MRSRIDWKYLLCLELTDSGFDHTVLSEFRTRLLKAGAEQLLFDTLLSKLREEGLLKARGRQRTDSTHVLAAVRAMNRLKCVVETMRQALNCLAVVALEWLREHSPAEWVDRYGPRADDYRLPTTKAEREAYADVVGADGWTLLTDLYASEAPLWLREVPVVETLRRVWVQQHIYVEGTIRSQEAYEARQAGRRRQQSDEFKEQYKKRAGAEGTISQAVRAFGMRRSR